MVLFNNQLDFFKPENYQLPWDIIYPLLFTINNSLALAYFLKKLNQLKKGFFYLSLLPLAAGLADYMENIGINVLLHSYPDVFPVTVTIKSSFSLIKCVVTQIYFFILIGKLIAVGVKTQKK